MFYLRRPRCILSQRRWMSVRPAQIPDAATSSRQKITLQTLESRKATRTPITVLTAYDYPTAVACQNNDVDITLVGDSLAQVCLGYSSTTHLTLADMIHHCRAVARGTTHPLLVADMPFGSYHASVDDAVTNAVQLVQQGNVEAVKLEGGAEIVNVVRKLTSVGIPIMAHVGLMPQKHVSLSGYKVQGKDAATAKRVLDDAMALQDAGAFSIVLEAIPHALGKYITERLKIPTIGIGAGPWTDGQVLVWDDAMGTWPGHKAKFVRRFGELGSARTSAVESYARAVRSRSFPDEIAESYIMEAAEWAKFIETKRDIS